MSSSPTVTIISTSMYNVLYLEIWVKHINDKIIFLKTGLLKHILRTCEFFFKVTIISMNAYKDVCLVKV